MEKKEAMKILKEFHDKSALFSVRTALDTVIPELNESADERIREAIIKILHYTFSKDSILFDVNIEDMIAWLEKQGEQKNKINSYKITFEDVLALECAMKTIEKADNELYEQLKSLHDRLHGVDWFEKQSEQNPAWSGYDEAGLGEALWAVEQARSIAKDENDMGNLWYAERWLESIKERMKGE